MFEDSTFESTGKIKTRSRRWMLVTLAVNGTILASLVLLPLIYPGALPRHTITSLLVAPEAPKQQPPEPATQRRIATANREFADGRIFAPPAIPTKIRIFDAPERPLSNDFAANFGLSVPGADGTSPFGNGQHVTVVHAPVPASIHLSSKLVEGNLIFKSVPQYPAIAKATHTEGVVVLQALISNAVTIEGLHVISGSPMLQQAALDAVKNWRYRPYMLNGQAVEVETTVNVIFKLQ
jgi:periplasmic protein TonB